MSVSCVSSLCLIGRGLKNTTLSKMELREANPVRPFPLMEIIMLGLSTRKIQTCNVEFLGPPRSKGNSSGI